MIRNSSRAGFTLIELLVVIAIIGILAALLLPVLAKARCHAKEGTAIAMINDLGSALKAYEADYGVFPATQSGNTTNGLIVALGGGELVGQPALLGPHGMPYYEFKKETISNNEFYSPLNEAFYYSCARNPMSHTQRKKYTYDFWTHDCATMEKGLTGAETVANETKCKNW